jgi:hypothetical protein
MKPRWIDSLDLQIAMSAARWEEDVTPTTMLRRAMLKQSCPGLTDALAWCAERRMGVQLVTVPLAAVSNEFLEEARARDGGRPYGLSCLLSPATMITRPVYHARTGKPKGTVEVPRKPNPVFSHRLLFKTPNHAFEFKMRWL